MVAATFPFTQPEIVAGLKQLTTEGQAFWSAIPSEVFMTKPETSWSPAMNVLHLVKGVKAVATAMPLPRWLVRLVFGKASAPSRHGEALRQHYLEMIKGVVVTGKYAPATIQIDTDAATTQQKLIASLTKSMEKLTSGVEKWSEADLDRLQLPHPLLGKLTVREMLFFTIFHSQHHMENVRVKLSQSV